VAARQTRDDRVDADARVAGIGGHGRARRIDDFGEQDRIELPLFGAAMEA